MPKRSSLALLGDSLDNAAENAMFGTLELAGGKPVKRLVSRFKRWGESLAPFGASRSHPGKRIALGPHHKQPSRFRGPERVPELGPFNLDVLDDAQPFNDLDMDEDLQDEPHLAGANMPRRRLLSHSRNIKSSLSRGRMGPSRARTKSYAEVKRKELEVLRFANDTVTLLSKVEQGTETYKRIGDQLKMIQLGLNYIVVPDPNMAATSVYTWRMTVFQWNPNNSTPPVIADIFKQGAPNEIVSPARQFFNIPRKPTFHILYDVTGTLCGSGASNIPGTTTTGVVKITLRPVVKTLDFAPEGGVLGTHHIYCMFQCHDELLVAPAAATPQLSIGVKLSYIDS